MPSPRHARARPSVAGLGAAAVMAYTVGHCISQLLAIECSQHLHGQLLHVRINPACCTRVCCMSAAWLWLPPHQGLAEGDAAEFELELVDFDKAPNWEAMGADAKIARAEALKEQGNRVFKAGPALFKHAAQKWTKAIQLVDHAFDIDTAQQVLPALLPDAIAMAVDTSNLEEFHGLLPLLHMGPLWVTWELTLQQRDAPTGVQAALSF